MPNLSAPHLLMDLIVSVRIPRRQLPRPKQVLPGLEFVKDRRDTGNKQHGKSLSLGRPQHQLRHWLPFLTNSIITCPTWNECLSTSLQ